MKVHYYGFNPQVVCSQIYESLFLSQERNFSSSSCRETINLSTNGPFVEQICILEQLYLSPCVFEPNDENWIYKQEVMHGKSPWLFWLKTSFEKDNSHSNMEYPLDCLQITKMLYVTLITVLNSSNVLTKV